MDARVRATGDTYLNAARRPAMCASAGCRECLTAEITMRTGFWEGLAVILLVGGRHTSGLAR